MRIIAYLKQHYILTLILVVAALLRFAHLGSQSPWMDEIYTLNVSDPKLPFATTIAEINLREGFPYIYFLAMKVLFAIFGHHILVARIVSALAGVAGSYIVYRLGKSLYGKNTGLIAAGLVAVSDYCIYISQDARPYSLYFFAVVLSFWAMSNFLRNNSTRNAIFYGLSAGLLLNLNFFGFINLFSQALLILLFIVMCPKDIRRNFIVNSLIVGAIAVLLFIPNIAKLMTLFGFKSGWIVAATNDSIAYVLDDFLGNTRFTAFIFLPLFFYFLFDVFRQEGKFTYKDILERPKVFAFAVLLSWMVVLVVILTVKSFTDTSLMITRYFVSVLPVILLILAHALSLIKNQVVRAGMITTVLCFMLMNLFVFKRFYLNVHNSQFREASEFVMKNNAKREPVYTSLKYWFNYFFLKKDANYPLNETASLDVLVNEMRNDPSKVKAFWYVDAHDKQFQASPETAAFLDANFFLENNFEGFQGWAKHYILKADAKQIVSLAGYDLSKPVSGDDFVSTFDIYQEDETGLKIFGWAYFPGQGTENTKIEIIVLMGNRGKLFNMEKVQRADVTQARGAGFNLDNSGFSAKILKSDLKPGSYRVAILMTDSATGKKGLKITDSVLEIKQ
ncbi:glycosyltransferase family 39 protein [Flavobacterium sp. MAH-1]|uniref:Glycosyltransferase family 39 protein n=1 Tax=Flavobacterium agri TaxID=2743471 RepID=A0A7Y8Y0J0_9FLAO|nr:glycosyltransferase family 39 protein [Flavobacterium agri]NUY80136.1 glycosyltransferase family 39 protein [Flavobacterium agri]NYA70161.1 glycosyltransferase family 39 protein [Flavobacterium agri]